MMHTDYESALVYICREVQSDDSCEPGKEFVHAYSRSHSLTRGQIEVMTHKAYSACFSEDDFEWIEQSGQIYYLDYSDKIMYITYMEVRNFTYLNRLRQMWYVCVGLSIVYQKRYITCMLSLLGYH